MPPSSPLASATGATRSGDTADDLHLQALQWQVVLWSGEVTQEERDDFESWLRASPAHLAAWNALQPLQNRLAFFTDPRAAALALRNVSHAGRRRTVLRSILAVFAAGALAHGVQRTTQWKRAATDHHTASGEIRGITLDDGSRVTLNTSSGVDIHFTAQERRIRLIAGEILVTTAPDPLAGQDMPGRPFRVETAHGTLQALGTEFSVRQMDASVDGQTHVAVLQGAVLVQPDGLQAARRIDAGQQTCFTRSDVGAAKPLLPEQSEWRNGRLVAEQMRLQDFAGELARYRPGRVQVDPAVANLPVSGSYPLADTDHILQTLHSSLPVRVRYLTPYWVRITAP